MGWTFFYIQKEASAWKKCFKKSSHRLQKCTVCTVNVSKATLMTHYCLFWISSLKVSRRHSLVKLSSSVANRKLLTVLWKSYTSMQKGLFVTRAKWKWSKTYIKNYLRCFSIHADKGKVKALRFVNDTDLKLGQVSIT